MTTTSEPVAPRSDRRFAAWVAIAFFVVACLSMLRHEMWRDELEAFLAGRDSANPIDVVRNTRYNGHPVTWYLLLHAVTRITHDPRGMQLLHAFIATAGVYVVARHAPFSRLQRVLFCFGYFPLFEYGVISREYVLGVVALFAFCAAYAAGANVIVLALIAGLLAQTSAYGMMISMALAATVVLARIAPRSMGVPPMPHGRDARATNVLACVIYLVALGLGALQLIPPADSGTVVGWTFDNPIRLFPLSIVWRAIVPVPPIDPQFWNENVVGSNKIVGPLSLLLFPIVLLALRKHRVALVLFAIGSMGLMTFGFIKFYGSIRHHGHMYLILIAALWLAASAEPLCRRLSAMFTGLLVVHVIAAIIAISIDWVRPFSQSKATAAFLRERGLAGAFLIGERDTFTAPIAAYLDRTIYFPRGDRIGSYIIYDQRRVPPVSNNLVEISRAKAREIGGEVVLISTSPLPDDASAGVTHIGSFTGSVVGDEDFFLYQVLP